MADYTPTTEDVQDAYVRRRADEKRFLYSSRTRPRARAEFRRWLAAHDREVAKRAWAEGCTIGYVVAADGRDELENPYNEGGAS